MSTENLRSNLRRIFKHRPRGHQAIVARDAHLSAVHLSNLVRPAAAVDPKMSTVEAIAWALKVPVAVLISRNPPDADLGIFQDSGK